jgi:hypothetical protein
MLDTKAGWDSLIRRHARDAKSAERVLRNPLYDNITARFVNSHDYIAMEQINELASSPDFDLVVIDTPPSRNALDLLDAPRRMREFFGGRLLQWLTLPYRSRLLTLASKPFLQIADRLLGAQFLPGGLVQTLTNECVHGRWHVGLQQVRHRVRARFQQAFAQFGFKAGRGRRREDRPVRKQGRVIGGIRALQPQQRAVRRRGIKPPGEAFRRHQTAHCGGPACVVIPAVGERQRNDARINASHTQHVEALGGRPGIKGVERLCGPAQDKHHAVGGRQRGIEKFEMTVLRGLQAPDADGNSRRDAKRFSHRGRR